MTLDESRRGSAGSARRVCSATAHERRSARRDVERRARLERHRRADGAAHVTSRSRRSRSGLPRPAQKRARRRASRRRALRHRPSRARALVRGADGRPRRAHLVHGRACRRPVRARIPRAVGARRQRVTVALSGQGADELLGRYREAPRGGDRRPWSALPGPVRSVGAAALRSAPAGSAVRRGRWTPRTGGAAARASGRLEPGSRRISSADRWRSSTGTPPCGLRGSASAASGRSAARRPVPGRPTRARRRHAPLLRPRFDGALARGARPFPRSPPRRVLRHDSFPPQGAAPRHEARAEATPPRTVPDRIIDKPKIGFFHAALTRWFRAQTRGAISDYLLGPTPRYAEILDRGRVERLVTRPCRRDRRSNGRVLLSS